MITLKRKALMNETATRAIMKIYHHPKFDRGFSYQIGVILNELIAANTILHEEMVKKEKEIADKGLEEVHKNLELMQLRLESGENTLTIKRPLVDFNKVSNVDLTPAEITAISFLFTNLPEVPPSEEGV